MVPTILVQLKRHGGYSEGLREFPPPLGSCGTLRPTVRTLPTQYVTPARGVVKRH
jgi:hypothetical protein